MLSLDQISANVQVIPLQIEQLAPEGMFDPHLYLQHHAASSLWMSEWHTKNGKSAY